MDDESKPLLKSLPADDSILPEDSIRYETPTKNILLPLGMFLFALGLQLGSTSFQQYVYNSTSSADGHPNISSLFSNGNTTDELSCGKNETSSQNQNEKESANLILYLETIEFSIGLPVILIAGIYSDFYGRKAFLLLSTFGASLYLLVIALVVFFNFPTFYIYVAYGIYGITGTHYTFYLAATTLIADTTKAGKNRSFHITMIYAYIGTGLTLASVGSGFFIQYTGFAVPLAASSGSCFLATVLLSFQRETLTEKIRAEKPPFFQTFLRSLGFFVGKGYAFGAKQWKFMLVLIAFNFNLSPLTTVTALTTLFQLGEPFCFSAEMIGYFQASADFAHLVIGTIFLKILYFCINDEHVTIIGLVSGVAYFTIMGFSSSVWMVYMGAGCGLLAIIPLSVYRGIMSGMVSPKYQGALFSLVYLCEALCRLSGNAIFMSIYGHTQSFMKGFVFVVMAGFYAISCLLFM
ncbi:hypothetical protein FSP39_024692 [Pinctada imbricata]|uniref:Proton-coupled folate transporter-like protein n=1 Tax=Pinctada imbricata TaxID=66713 RepID=A0AA89CB99_PINIB|nr:hypothetical protein FSP39_024692 [Pinctada imbricata]